MLLVTLGYIRQPKEAHCHRVTTEAYLHTTPMSPPISHFSPQRGIIVNPFTVSGMSLYSEAYAYRLPRIIPLYSRNGYIVTPHSCLDMPHWKKYPVTSHPQGKANFLSVSTKSNPLSIASPNPIHSLILLSLHHIYFHHPHVFPNLMGILSVSVTINPHFLSHF